MMITAVASVGMVLFALYSILKGRNLTTPIISLTEKEKIQAEGRELSDNQMRTAKIHIGSIRTLLREQSYELFPDMTALESAYMELLTGKITDNLLEQFRIDLVRNHIIKKSEDELKIYTQAKANTYYTKIRLFLDDYNHNILKYDFKKIIDSIPYQRIYDIYYESYLSAKQLSVGY
jgi:hypothetical protein